MEAEKELKDLATTQVTLVTAQYAVTMAAVLALAKSAVQAVFVMRVMDVVKG